MRIPGRKIAEVALRGFVASAACMVFALHASAQPIGNEVGLDVLIQRVGAGNQPTGAGVVLAQVEVGAGGTNYGPDQNSAEFAGKTFTAQTGPPGVSGHATTVGTFMYGNNFSIAPGVTSVFLYEVNAWIVGGYLNADQPSTVAPLRTPGGIKTFNHSWVGTTGLAGNDNLVNRRTDFAIRRDHVVMTAGMNCCNGAPMQPLLSHSYNGIAVGMTNPIHTFGLTLGGGHDGPGRMKPDIVAPGSATSYATPVVNGAAALMVQTVRTTPALTSNPNAERSDVLKAILLGGAHHTAEWTNNPATSGMNRGVTASPLDQKFGAGVVNVNNSHLIVTGLQQAGAAASPALPNVSARGWDYANLNVGQSRFYRFHLGAPASEVSLLATWHRIVPSNFGVPTVANFDLILWRVGPGNTVTTLVGDAGLPYFSAGNVVSQSAVDNVEHLYIKNLQPGDYVLEVKRQDALAGSRDVAVTWLIPFFKPGDLNGDGLVNVDDLVALLGAWGACVNGPGCVGDTNSDGNVNVDDLVALLGNWG